LGELEGLLDSCGQTKRILSGGLSPVQFIKLLFAKLVDVRTISNHFTINHVMYFQVKKN